MLTRAQSGDLPRLRGNYKFNKTPTEVTYSKLTNSKKPNKGGQHLEKKQRGTNILEVKYQKVTYRRYFTEVKYKKVSTKVGNLRSATKHASGAFGPGADPSCLRQVSASGQVGKEELLRWMCSCDYVLKSCELRINPKSYEIRRLKNTPFD